MRSLANRCVSAGHAEPRLLPRTLLNGRTACLFLAAAVEAVAVDLEDFVPMRALVFLSR